MNEARTGEALLHLVAEFHTHMGLPVRDAPSEISAERLAARASWLFEEVYELASSSSIIEQLDATLDIIYLALGNLVEMGAPLSPAFEAVHRANLAKRWPDGLVHTDRDGKILKPPGWRGPEDALRAILEAHGRKG